MLNTSQIHVQFMGMPTPDRSFLMSNPW